MENPIFGVTKAEVLAFIEKMLAAVKNAFAWLGILILPEGEEE